MTEIGELIATANKSDKKDKCPFCPDKDLDDCKQKKQKPTTKVVSKPNQLACGTLAQKGTHTYTTAKHHLISAKQCYAKIRRLVRMGSMVGYDINDPPNGIALPTVANNLRFTAGKSKQKKYGQLSPDEKEAVAFSIMASAKAQWHVGHHAVTVELAEQWADEEEDAPWRRGHFVSYDTEVIAQLLKLLSKYKPEQECDPKKAKDFKSDMDNLSDQIKGKLKEFEGADPGGSAPYFVSQLAAQYALSKILTPTRKASLGKRQG
jgi:hypothetical protein